MNNAPAIVVAFFLTIIPGGQALAIEEENIIGEVVVTAQRREQSKFLHAGNIDQLDQETVEAVGHQHVHELLSRVAGVWVVRGSGQEHLTAIRSPVLTGGGSCGGFLLLEDSIPVRPTGFCNVNQFIELVTEQAASVEVIRGPGNALFGSNALHGVINVLMPQPGTASPQVSLEVG
jgi:iron complex outermembrane receptor protein